MAMLAPWHKRDHHVSSQCPHSLQSRYALARSYTCPLYAHVAPVYYACGIISTATYDITAIYVLRVTGRNEVPIISFDF